MKTSEYLNKKLIELNNQEEIISDKYHSINYLIQQKEKEIKKLQTEISNLEFERTEIHKKGSKLQEDIKEIETEIYQ